MRFYLHGLIVLALLLAGISPACAFVSGKTDLVEICTAQGVAYKQIPGAPDGGDHRHKKQSDCAFCFAQSHGKSLKASSVLIVAMPASFAAPPELIARDFAQDPFYNPHAARAPPALL